MSRLRFTGPFHLRLRSFLTLNQISIQTYARHLFGKQIAPDWDALTEIGIRFWRHQFTVAMQSGDMVWGRKLFDSLQTETDEVYAVTSTSCPSPCGTWHRPTLHTSSATILHFHGGGYGFHGGISRRYAAMLAHHIGADLFAPDYRLTPENPHPAQIEDALAAWQYVSALVPPEQIVVTGDSAGGHLALMLLLRLRDEGLPQPALCIGLCPWTDIGDRGASLHENDHCDMVQGWMALMFGEWLDPEGQFGREALSPCYHDYSGLAPIYLQAGGREILRDMILDFARIQRANGAELTLDLWPDMPHVFQAYDGMKASSAQALKHIGEHIRWRVDGDGQAGEIPGVTIV